MQIVKMITKSNEKSCQAASVFADDRLAGMI
jgi:hypothetical protein